MDQVNDDSCGQISSWRTSAADYPLFWIKLQGLIAEHVPTLNLNRSIGEALGLSEILVAADELVDSLTDEDKRIIEYLRVSHCHIHQSYVRYGLRVHKTGDVQVHLPRDGDVVELFTKRLAAANGNQQDLAKAIADKVIGPLIKLKKAYERYNAV